MKRKPRPLYVSGPRTSHRSTRIIDRHQDAHTSLSFSSGMLFANPVPAMASIPRDVLETIIQRALEAAERAGAVGGRNTPYVLNEIKTLSGGRSVKANTALVEANVIRGTKVAVELSKLEAEGSSKSSL